MSMEDDRKHLNAITETVIGCAYQVGKVLGCGFLEKVYENALVHELRRSGLKADQQHLVQIYYDDVVVGDYVADIFVEDEVLVELKAVQELNEMHVAQCLNYLHGTGKKICLLINFGKTKVEVRRIVNHF